VCHKFETCDTHLKFVPRILKQLEGTNPEDSLAMIVLGLGTLVIETKMAEKAYGWPG